MAELPIPEAGGDISDLKSFVNLATERDFCLFVGWVLGAYQPAGEFLLGLILGVHGSAKTSALKIACSLIDPVQSEPLSPPREDRDVAVVAQTSHVQAWDNAREISSERSAVLCRLLTGGAVRGRALFTDKDQFHIAAHKPVMLTATGLIIVEEDLLDRSVLISTGNALGQDGKSQRKSRHTMEQRFKEVHPRLLGAILDGVSEGLRRQDDPEPANLPRMSDWATWVSRCETGLGWTPGTILAAYNAAISEAAHEHAELHPVSAALLAFAGKSPTWEGSMTELLTRLTGLVHERVRQGKDWPRSPAALSRRLNQLSTILRRCGVRLEWARDRSRAIKVERLPETTVRPNGEDQRSTVIQDPLEEEGTASEEGIAL
jgi:hypothetical protein